MAKRKLESAIDDAISKLQKDHGTDIAARYGNVDRTPKGSVPTGILSLDMAINPRFPGFPRGAISEIFGPESHGKSAVSLHAIAACQRAGGTAVLVDLENAFDEYWAAGLGVDVDKLIVSTPAFGEQALEVIKALVVAGADLVVVDSVANIVPRAEAEGDIGQNFYALTARLMSQASRMFTPVIGKSNTAVVFINQIRDKMDAMAYGPKTDTPGGHALKHWASVRVETRRIGAVKEGDAIVGIQVRAKVVKNKTAPASQIAEFEIYGGACECHGKGVYTDGDIFDVAVERGLIEKDGAHFYLAGQKLGHGRNASAAALAQNGEATKQIVDALLGIPNTVEASK